MSRVFIFGIDSVDKELFSRFEDDLPNLKKLRELSPKIKLTAVYPPDSPTAWASILTGLNPAKHGVLYYIDPLEKASALLRKEIDISNIRKNTFWDIASNSGKKVCILFPLLGYPVWPVNGIMVGRSTVCDDVQAYPSSIEEEYDLSKLSNLRGVPGRNISGFIQQAKELVENEAEFVLNILRKYNWDLFFVYSSVLDPIQHNFWSYFDERDPTHQVQNPYKGVIKDFYKLYDKVIGRYLDAISSDVVIIVFSDHGHCMRPVKLVNINELLRKKGYLVAKGNKPGKFGIEKLKRDLFGVMTKYKLGQLALKVLYAFPEIKKIYTAPPSIDFMKTYAHISDLSGIKAYSYGGIKIRKENIKDIGYEQLRNILVNELCNIKDPDTGENLVRWVRKREDLYQGIYISEYPDIVFELNENYGAGWAIYEPLITTSYSHNIHPGSHRAETPIFLLSNLEGKECVRENMTLTDVAPTILDLLHIKNDFDFDGKSIFRE